MSQKVLKQKLKSLNQFPLPFDIKQADFSVETNDKISPEVVSLVTWQLTEGFTKEKKLMTIMNNLRVTLTDVVKGQWMVLFHTKAKSSCSSSRYRYLTVQFVRDET